MKIDNERIRSLYITAKYGAVALEGGDVEPAYEALNTIADALYLVALENDVYLMDEEA